MADDVNSAEKEVPKPAVKPAGENRKRLPHSIRKYIRRTKAGLRRELPSADAEKAIEQLVTRLRN